MHRPKIFLAGIGEVGRYVLEFLARDPQPYDIYVAEPDLVRLQGIANNVQIGSLHHSSRSHIFPIEADLLDVERTAEHLSTIRPDIVVNLAVLQTWHVIRVLPSPYFERLSAATLGAWLPVQLSLAFHLGKAMQVADLHVPYINTSLSCLTNPALHSIGITPTVGIGNVDLIAPAVRLWVARHYAVGVENVEVKLVAHHVHWVTPREPGYRQGAPFHLQIWVDGDEVTNDFEDLWQLMTSAILQYLPDTSFSAVSASSTVKNIKALLAEEAIYTHSPAPDGLPGGYPLKISATGVELALPDGLTSEQAIALNWAACRFDGIEDISARGWVTFTAQTQEIMLDVLGVEQTRFHVSECHSLALEQMAKFAELKTRLGVA